MSDQKRWTKIDVFGFARYLLDDGRIRIIEATVSKSFKAGWGHPRHTRSSKVWRVFLDDKRVVFNVSGRSMTDFARLKDAKQAAETLAPGNPR